MALKEFKVVACRSAFSNKEEIFAVFTAIAALAAVTFAFTANTLAFREFKAAACNPAFDIKTEIFAVFTAIAALAAATFAFITETLANIALLLRAVDILVST